MTESKHTTLYHGDCLSILPALGSVDAIITDPVWPNAPSGMFPSVVDAQELLRACLEKVDARRVVIVLRGDSDPRFLIAVPARWPFFRVQILPYVMPGYIGRKLGGDEMAYCFGEPLPYAPGQRVIPGRAPAAQPCDRKDNGHPCSRALAHFKWLVRWWSMPGEVVLDPFMGSGTTGVACVNLQRRFVGIEIDSDYFKIAERRIADASCQLHLFQDVLQAEQMRMPNT